VVGDERRVENVADTREAEPAGAGGAVAGRRRSGRTVWIAAVLAVLVFDVFAFFVAPPFVAGHPGTAAAYPADFLTANFHFPPPTPVISLDGSEPPHGQLIYFHPSISDTIITSWIVMAFILLVAFIATRRLRMRPGPFQSAVEFVIESLASFAVSLGGPRARRYIPLFAALFIFILLSNWSGLIPLVGRVEFLRAPTSDLNITIGLALVSFCVFHVEGVRALGFRGYLGKFFPLRTFRGGFVAGLIAMFVGLVEFFLEFIKPVTLSMRLFGNIYGGELALAVITALTVAVIPVALMGLELLLNFVQALIFSVLTLMFTLIAIEGPDEEVHAQEHGAEGVSAAA
jgi:F-type H+-transporting ATPase subunit a